MTTINNCTELLNHLYTSYSDYLYVIGGHIDFLGKKCEVGGMAPNPRATFYFSPYHEKVVFSVVRKDYWDDNSDIILCIFKGPLFVLDETLGVKLPGSILPELIATLKGKI